MTRHMTPERDVVKATHSTGEMHSMIRSYCSSSTDLTSVK